MGHFEFMILYVNDLAVSRRFYDALVGHDPHVLSPTFVSYELPTGLKLELCQRDSRIFTETTRPTSAVLGGGTELCLSVADEAALQQLYQAWQSLGAEVLQAPSPSIFGLNFIVADPDGHRLRAMVAA